MKNKIRSAFSIIRSKMSNDEVCRKSLAAEQRFIESDVYKKSRCLMLYMPIKNETDTSEILRKALSEGKKVALPVTDKESGEIGAYVINSETVFTKGAYSIPEPSDAERICTEEIDTVLVPGIAFDANGARIGFGKGYYDRFLRNGQMTKVGFCYDFQIAENIVSDLHDVNMDIIFTNEERIDCKKI